MYLLFSSKYLACAFICGSPMDNGKGKALHSRLYPMKSLNESSLSDFLSDNAILLISTLLILIGLFFYEKRY